MLKYPQAWFVECAHGNGDAQAAGEARGHLDCAHRVSVSSGHPFYQRLNELLEAERFDEFVEDRCAKFYAAKVRPAVVMLGIYFRSLLIGYFEGIDSERGIAWRLADSLALRRFVGIGLDEQHAGPLDDFAHAAADRCGHASRSVRLGTELVGGWWTAAGQAGGDRCDHAGSQRGDALDRAAGHGGELRGVLARIGEGFRPGNADPRGPARLDRKRKKRMSNQEWKSPADEDARIAKMKDGRTHLAHKAEHAVDLDTGAVVAVTLQGADQGDTTTLEETLCEAGMAVAEQIGREAELRPGEKPKVNVKGIEELVTDKGYHSGAVVERVKSYEIRSYLPEKQQKGPRNWQGKAEEQQAVYQNRRRVRGNYSKSLLRRRGELVERSFAHCYDTGGMRRTHLRGHENILKRQLVHVGAFNLSLILRQLLGAGTPREWRNRFAKLVLFLYWLGSAPLLAVPTRKGSNRLCRSRIPTDTPLAMPKISDFHPGLLAARLKSCPDTNLGLRHL